MGVAVSMRELWMWFVLFEKLEPIIKEKNESTNCDATEQGKLSSSHRLMVGLMLLLLLLLLFLCMLCVVNYKNVVRFYILSRTA